MKPATSDPMAWHHYFVPQLVRPPETSRWELDVGWCAQQAIASNSEGCIVKASAAPASSCNAEMIRESCSSTPSVRARHKLFPKSH